MHTSKVKTGKLSTAALSKRLPGYSHLPKTIMLSNESEKTYSQKLKAISDILKLA